MKMDDVRKFAINLILAVLGFLSPINDFLFAVALLFGVNFICGLLADVVEGHQLARTKQMVSCIIFNDTQKAALSATEKAVLINKGWTLA